MLLTVVFIIAPLKAQEQEKEILEKVSKSLYNQVPDVEISLPNNQKLLLSELWKDKPVLINFFYRECTGTCNPFLRSLKTTVEKVGGISEDYRILSLSFDPKDGPREVAAMAEAVGVEKQKDWMFGTIKPIDIQKISDAIGFWYRLDSKTGQFDHASSITAVRNGKVIRVLLGSLVTPTRFRDMLYELKGTFVPTYSNPGENVLFRCFRVDELSKSVKFGWGMLILFIPGFCALLIAGVLFHKSSHSREPMGLS